MSHKADKAFQFRSYLTPKHWPTWFGIGLLRLAIILPNAILHPLGKSLGMLIYHVAPSRRKAARKNLVQAFPTWNNQEIENLNKTAFKSLGASIFEMGVAWFSRIDKLKQHCEIEGKQHLDAAIEKNKGVILLTGHFTTLEIGARLIASYTEKFTGVYKTARNPLFNAIMVHYRLTYGVGLINNKNVRTMIRDLKSGHELWFAPDQDFRRQEIVFTPFLGGVASTLTATAKLAKITGATVVPFYPVRINNGRDFKLIVLPELENFPSGDIELDSARVNKTIEEMVYACPEQYLWSHKRFKTQPDRNTDFYAS